MLTTFNLLKVKNTSTFKWLVMFSNYFNLQANLLFKMLSDGASQYRTCRCTSNFFKWLHTCRIQNCE